jgi:hypothetical protein
VLVAAVLLQVTCGACGGQQRKRGDLNILVLLLLLLLLCRANATSRT